MEWKQLTKKKTKKKKKWKKSKIFSFKNNKANLKMKTMLELTKRKM